MCGCLDKLGINAGNSKHPQLWVRGMLLSRRWEILYLLGIAHMGTTQREPLRNILLFLARVKHLILIGKTRLQTHKKIYPLLCGSSFYGDELSLERRAHPSQNKLDER